MLNETGQVLQVNDKWLEETGYKREEVIGQFFGNFITEDSFKVVQKNFPHLKEYGFVNNALLKLKRKDGLIIETVLNGISVYDENNRFLNTRCELKTLDYFLNSTNHIKNLLEKEQFLRGNLFVKSQINHAIIKSQTLNEFLNSVKNILLEPTENLNVFIASKNINDYTTLISGTDQDTPYSSRMRTLLEKDDILDNIPDKIMIFDKDNSRNPFKEIINEFDKGDILAVLPIFSNKLIQVEKVFFILQFKKMDKFEEEYLLFLREIREILYIGIDTFEMKEKMNQTLEELYKLSTHDMLTKTFNRYKLETVGTEEVKRFQRYETPFSIIMFDIDDFKKINDKFDHSIGDLYLVNLSKLVSECLRDTDKLFRLGGDEFLIILSETKSDEALCFCERLRKIIASSDYKFGKMTCSFGLSEVISGDTLASITKRADKALYKSKNNGKNCISLLIE